MTLMLILIATVGILVAAIVHVILASDKLPAYKAAQPLPGERAPYALGFQDGYWDAEIGHTTWALSEDDDYWRGYAAGWVHGLVRARERKS